MFAFPDTGPKPGSALHFYPVPARVFGPIQRCVRPIHQGGHIWITLGEGRGSQADCNVQRTPIGLQRYLSDISAEAFGGLTRAIQIILG